MFGQCLRLPGRRVALISAVMLALGAVTGGAAAEPVTHPATPRVVRVPSAAALARPDYKQACTAARAGQMACLALVRTDVRPQRQPADRPGQAPADSGYGPASLQSAYALPSLTAGLRQTVAVIDAYNDPDAASDLAAYRAAWGLSACGAGCFSVVNQEGKASPLPADAGSTGWDVEESLDVDMVSAICPNCRIILVEASSTAVGDLGAAENAAVKLGAKYVSNSYGGVDSSLDAKYDTAYYQHPGVAVTAAAGDNGYGVQYPATSQYVTAVGGTTLTPADNARGWTETVWGSKSGGPGTGSGCSAYEAKPSWQKDAGCSHRTDNDVAADANPNTGVAIYDTYSQGGWVEAGGTSIGAPLIASVYALAGRPPAGTYPAATPYANRTGLYKITSGANGTCKPSYLCTARGLPNGPGGNGSPQGTSSFCSVVPTTMPQLGFVKDANDASGKVEVHVDDYNGSSYCRILDTTSDFNPADAPNGTFQLFGYANGEPELGFIKTAHTSSGKVEVHVDTYSNGSYHRVLDTTSDFNNADAPNGTFWLFGAFNNEPELGFIKTAHTSSGKVEVHVDTYSNGSYHRVLDTTSDFNPADAPNGTFQLFGYANGEPELGFIKTANTGSGTIEVHIDSYSNSSYHRILDTTSDFNPADAPNGPLWLVTS